MAMWNPWRGCKKCSEGCLHCYIHKGDAKRGVDTSIVEKTKDFSKLVGTSRLSFASSEDLAEILDLTPGSVSIMGLINDKEKRVHLAIDKDVLIPDFIGCHPCINTSSLKIKKADLLEKYLPAVGHTPTFVELPRYEEE